MVLPHTTPTTPAEHESIQTVATFEPAVEKANAVPLSTFPTTESPVAEPQQATPALCSTDLPVLSPFGPLTSHLPTPQSPSNAGPYLNGKNESPVLNGAASPQRTLGDNPVPSSPRQMLTPDSSPTAARKWALHEGDTTPMKKRKTPPKTPPLPAHLELVKEESPRASSGTLAESASADSPGQSALSSPFMQQARSTSPPHPPSSPSPVRPAGGEIARIRADEATSRAAQERLAEARRPEYMKRTLRGDVQSSTDMLGLGIAETPVKGRRIELWGFQETSEESFEERLMAGGYGGYGSTAPERATTPPAAPSRALEWANSLTPGPRGSSSNITHEDAPPDSPADEREARKRRRLGAFSRAHMRVNTSLHPVEVGGKGRVLLDVSAEEVPELLEELQSSTAGKKRGGKKRRRGGPGSRGGKARAIREEARPMRVREGVPLNWPDEEFPWNVRTHERRELAAAEEADRMRLIKRFLDEDSDAASSEDGPQDEDGSSKASDHHLGSPTMTHHHHRHGRGKMVLVPHRDSTNLQKIFVSSDPADARAALLSKQSVRAVAARRRMRVQPITNSDGEEILCICRGRDDGRELVQCDDCRTWYHLECLGINTAELGREEDPWFCHNCVALMNGLTNSEPTFALVEEEKSPLRRRRDPLFYETLQESPAIADWRFPHPNGPGPTTPKTNPSRTMAIDVHTRSSMGSRNGPQTPRNSSATTGRVRVYTTPGSDERIFQDDVSPFDPASTPSRGVRVGASVSSVFATPKWQIRVPPTYASSPYRDGTDPGGDGGGGSGSSGGAQLSSSPFHVLPHEDTPVDRSAPRPSLVLPSKRAQESPLMGRGGVVRGQPHPQDSPVPLGRKGKERQGGGARR